MRRDDLFLQDMVKACDKIAIYIKDGQEVFMVNMLVQDAVIRNLEIIGEACKNIPEDFRLSNPHIPWRRIAGTRDRLIHHYFGVKLDLVWETANKFVPQLRSDILELLESAG
jgi:uncharacterized protein with HEPN domain